MTTKSTGCSAKTRSMRAGSNAADVSLQPLEVVDGRDQGAHPLAGRHGLEGANLGEVDPLGAEVLGDPRARLGRTKLLVTPGDNPTMPRIREPRDLHQVLTEVGDNPGVRPADVREAAAAVRAAGGSPEVIRAFLDAFTAAGREGRLLPEAQARYETVLRQLVAEAPEPKASVVTARMSPEQLALRLEKVKGIQGTLRGEIRGLEQDLRATLNGIEARAAQADRLIQEQRQYQTTLRKKQDDRRTLLIFAAFGAFGAASTAVGLGSAMSIGDLQTTIDRLDREIRVAQGERQHFEAARARFSAEHQVRTRQLDGLRGLERALEGAIEAVGAEAEPANEAQRAGRLARELDLNEALAANLKNQVALLRNMRDHAQGFSAELDQLIGRLEADIRDLKARNEAATKELLGVVIDLVFATAGIDPQLRLGGLSLSKKKLLLEGSVDLRLAFRQQVEALTRKMAMDGLTDLTGSQKTARLLLQLLDARGDGKKTNEAVSRFLRAEAMAGLSPGQRLLVDAILAKSGELGEVTGLIGRVIAAEHLDQAKAQAALQRLNEGGEAALEEALG